MACDCMASEQGKFYGEEMGRTALELEHWPLAGCEPSSLHVAFWSNDNQLTKVVDPFASWTLAGAKSGKQCGVSFEVLQLQAINSKSVFRLPLNIHKCTFAWHLKAPNYSTYWWHYHQHSSVLWVHHYQQYITKTTGIISQLILLCLSTQGSTVSSMCKEVKSPKHCD
jgi:hypothetical protein